MKIVAVSDTHNQLDRVRVPPCDVLVHAGDATMMGKHDEIRKFNSHVRALKDVGAVKQVVMVAGNHDWAFQTNQLQARTWIPDVDHYLQDGGVEIGGVKFWGSPWQPEFCAWAFNLPRGRALRDVWDKIPEGTDVLITHGPPYGMLDRTPRGERVGCGDLMDAVLRVRPKVHVFGHIHDDYGVGHFDGIEFVNASTCDERYRPANAPVELEL